MSMAEWLMSMAEWLMSMAEWLMSMAEWLMSMAEWLIHWALGKPTKNQKKAKEPVKKKKSYQKWEKFHRHPQKKLKKFWIRCKDLH